MNAPKQLNCHEVVSSGKWAVLAAMQGVEPRPGKILREIRAGRAEPHSLWIPGITVVPVRCTVVSVF